MGAGDASPMWVMSGSGLAGDADRQGLFGDRRQKVSMLEAGRGGHAAGHQRPIMDRFLKAKAECGKRRKKAPGKTVSARKPVNAQK